DRLALPDQALGSVVATAERLGFAGVNVTHPFKQTMIPHLGRLDADAATIGAVNTVVLKDGGRSGHNTDCSGLAESFRAQMSGAALKSVLLFGAGGAGAAVGHALQTLGAADLAIIDSIPGRAERLAAKLSAASGRQIRGVSGPLASEFAGADGVVNA